MLQFPSPTAVCNYTADDFVEAAWNVAGRKVNKRQWLADFYQTAQHSIGLLIVENSTAMSMFRLTLQKHQWLCRRLQDIEQTTEIFFKDNLDYHYLKTIPGIGPIIALAIFTEGGDLRRFNHYRQFLKFCGFDLYTHQSGLFRGQSKLSTYGNARLRYAFWIAGTVALRMRENTFRKSLKII